MPPPFELSISNLIDRINAGPGLATTKLCHGFWEKGVQIQRLLEQQQADREISFEEAFERARTLLPPANWPLDLYLEVKDILATQHRYPNLLSLCSEYGWKYGDIIEGTPVEGLSDVQELIRTSHIGGAKIYDGLFWKKSISDGTFADFITAIRNKKTIIVGPNYIKTFGAFAKLENSIHVPVHQSKAAWKRHETVKKVIDLVNSMGSGTICLFEAGGCVSAWMVFQLHEIFPDSFFFVLGQSLNICNAGRYEESNWFLVDRQAVCDCIEKINSDWNHNRNDFAIESFFRSLPDERRWASFRNGCYESFLGEPEQFKVKTYPDAQIDFIENKSIDHELLKKILQPSKETNHWANFGPVTAQLEQAICRICHLSASQSVLMTKSGTEALYLAIGLVELEAERKLRWVVSALGFICTHTGPLADAIVIDCDKQGLLSIEELRQLPLDSWDGVILTNIFGLATELGAVITYCHSIGKEVVIDNATGLFSIKRDPQWQVVEAVSFHQTKPWGMGEGGCVIIHGDQSRTARQLINFGIGLPDSARRWSRNGKLADINSALILQRLINFPTWAPYYRMQSRRIVKLAKESKGYSTLLSLPWRGAVVAHVPLISTECNIDAAALENDSLTLRKYYRPLDECAKNANEIFRRIVCVPCHPRVSELSDRQLLNVMHEVRGDKANSR